MRTNGKDSGSIEQITWWLLNWNHVVLARARIKTRSATLYKARDVFDPRTETRRQDSGLSQIYKLIVSNSAKILTNMNMALSRQVEEENNSLPVTVCD